MTRQPQTLTLEKSRARLQAKAARAAARDGAAGAELIRRWPAARFAGQSVAGFWPIKDEIDVRPLMGALHDAGHDLYLPAIKRAAHPLILRRWSPSEALIKGPFNTREPAKSAPTGDPQIVLVPLLAFTARGDRLGYGGGFYDRTLAALSQRGPVFACGVAYAAQEAASLPVGAHDRKLDGVLTEAGFTDFR